MNSGRTYAHTVREGQGERTLVDLLATTYTHSTRDVWADHCREGRIHVNGEVSTTNMLVHSGDLVEYHRPPWREPDASVSLVILHKDDDLLVLRKPSGLPVLPSEMYWERTVIQTLRKWYPPDRLPSPVHRLGVGTSGVLLCAVTAAARRALGRALQERQVRKTYRALVSGVVERETFEVDVPIGPVPHSSWGGSVHGAVPGGGGGAKLALSRVRVVRRNVAAQTTLVQVEIPTGRAHQIRVHMAYSGHPLVGDPLYEPGGRPRPPSDYEEGGTKEGERPPLPRDVGYLLHSLRVELEHPTRGGRLTLSAPPPPELCAAGEAPFVEGEGEHVDGHVAGHEECREALAGSLQTGVYSQHEEAFSALGQLQPSPKVRKVGNYGL